MELKRIKGKTDAEVNAYNKQVASTILDGKIGKNELKSKGTLKEYNKKVF